MTAVELHGEDTIAPRPRDRAVGAAVIALVVALQLLWLAGFAYGAYLLL